MESTAESSAIAQSKSTPALSLQVLFKNPLSNPKSVKDLGPNRRKKSKPSSLVLLNPPHTSYIEDVQKTREKTSFILGDPESPVASPGIPSSRSEYFATARPVLATSLKLNTSGRASSRFNVGTTIQAWLLQETEEKKPALANVEALRIVGAWILRQPGPKSGLVKSPTKPTKPTETYASVADPEWGEKELMGLLKDKLDEKAMSKKDQNAIDELVTRSYIRQFMKRLKNLQSFTWHSQLPFNLELWKKMSTNLQHLDLHLGNLYRGTDDLDGMTSLTQLRTLKITGMMHSYQQAIWETAWKNSYLQTLELSVTPKPSFRVNDSTNGWVDIDTQWRLYDAEGSGQNDYLGEDGHGCIHYKYGTGEYLDLLCLRRARNKAASGHNKSWSPRTLSLTSPLSSQQNLHSGSLSFAELKLAGFIVGADCFFAPELQNLSRIEFMGRCVDAGIRLPQDTKIEAITSPSNIQKLEKTGEGIKVAAVEQKENLSDYFALPQEYVDSHSYVGKSKGKAGVKGGVETAVKTGKDMLLKKGKKKTEKTHNRARSDSAAYAAARNV